MEVRCNATSRTSGKGLVNIGGRASYQREDFANSPLEAALPVSISTPEDDEVATLALLAGAGPVGQHDDGGRTPGQAIAD